MTPELRSDPPADPSVLASLVRDPNERHERRCQAMERLVPTIEAVARRVARDGSAAGSSAKM